MVSKPVMYLDQGITVAGSGFNAWEPVVVSIELGESQFYDPVKGSQYLYNPTLGQADSNGGGAWTLTVEGPLNEVGSIAGGGSRGLSNIDRMLEAGVVTVLAVGQDGSMASWPVAVVAETPVVEAETPPSIATSLIVAPVVAGGEVSVYGAGFGPKERFSLVAVTGIGKGTSYGKQGQAYGFYDKGTLAPSGVFERLGLTLGMAEETGAFMVSISPTQAPGIYTLEAVGVEGSYATAPLVILAEAK